MFTFFKMKAVTIIHLMFQLWKFVFNYCSTEYLRIFWNLNTFSLRTQTINKKRKSFILVSGTTLLLRSSQCIGIVEKGHLIVLNGRHYSQNAVAADSDLTPPAVFTLQQTPWQKFPFSTDIIQFSFSSVTFVGSLSDSLQRWEVIGV